MKRSKITLLAALFSCLLAGYAAAGEPAPDPAAGPAPDKAPPAGVRNIGGPGDYGLRENLIRRLTNDPELPKGSWKLVLVNGGAVFSGTMPTWALKRRALVAASVARGIVNVTDQMQVPRGDVGDEQIGQAVAQVLEGYKEPLGLKAFEVEARDGAVTLSGTVKDFGARVRAEELAGSVGGVTQISNRLRPADAPSGTNDASLRKAVVSYLRNPRAYPYRGEIQVQVKSGKVVLKGRLPYFLARQQAGAMAALVGGVGDIDNLIQVDPSTLVPEMTVTELP